MSGLRIVIPSHKRHDRVFAKYLVNDPIICVTKSQADIYKQFNPDCEIVTHPDDVVGLIPKRNWMAKHFRNLFMLDDDVDACKKLYTEKGESARIRDRNEITKIIENLYDIACMLDVHLFGFNPMHAWERYGEKNEYPGVAWIEGPWIIKRNGIYYLEYSASGTQWKTYAEGYYTATSPLGPYSYAPNNPLLRKTEGLVTGTAHGSIVKVKDKDEWWQFYTIVLSNPPGGRRIGMDKVTFDADGLMACTVTDTPQAAPGATLPTGVPASIPVTINKMNAMDAHSSCSSQQDGYPAAFAVDNFSGTVWRPAADDPQPSLTVELSPATRFDVVQHFTVDAMRILFSGGGRRFGPQRELPVYRYKLEVSQDGNEFKTVLDKTGNNQVKDTVYDEFAPVNCRFVRLTVTDWPKSSPLGIIDFTVFGYPDGYDPPAVATPVFSNLPLDGEGR